MGAETISSTGLAERIWKSTWGTHPQRGRINKLKMNLALGPHNLKLFSTV